MALDKVLALGIGVIAAVIIFFIAYDWFSGILSFGILGVLLAILLSAAVAYIVYLIIMAIYSAAKSK